jgi:cellulose synthase/poly-beta-1,6-N-acetylglucosamine synthase-like glycosyltransferase
MTALPLITVIIPTRPGQQQIKALDASRKFNYPKDSLEIIVARGRQPAIQRNEALKAAGGELIYFLDDDSVPNSENLRRLVRHFDDKSVQMVGGPNLCPAEAPPLEKVFAAVLSSWLAFGPSRARYCKVGGLRASSEKELILCNMGARREAVLASGGFDEKLYPNEENALMDTLQKQGFKLLYDPDLIVERRPRPTLRAFAKMLMIYGRGRAEQFRVNPTPGSVLNFVPPLFCLYLVSFVLLALLRPGVVQFAAAPLGLYLFALIIQVLALVGSVGLAVALGAFPLILLTHVLYGIGFWRGLFTSLAKPKAKLAAEVQLERIAPAASVS